MEGPKTFLKAMLDEFRTPGQTAIAFSAELKELTHADKVWYFQALQEAGIACLPPAVAK